MLRVVSVALLLALCACSSSPRPGSPATSVSAEPVPNPKPRLDKPDLGVVEHELQDTKDLIDQAREHTR